MDKHYTKNTPVFLFAMIAVFKTSMSDNTLVELVALHSNGKFLIIGLTSATLGKCSPFHNYHNAQTY